MRFLSLFALLFAVVLLPCSSAKAASVFVQVTVDITSSVSPGEVSLNDVFGISFTLDDSDADTDGSGSNGEFPGALTSVQMVRLSGPGTWDPTAISHSLLLTYTSESSQQIFFIPVLNDTPMLDGEPLESFQVALNTTINDTGSGQTLRNQLGGLLAATTGSFQLNVDEGVALNGTITSVTITDLSAVPEPSTFLTSALGLGSLLWPRRRKQSR